MQTVLQDIVCEIEVNDVYRTGADVCRRAGNMATIFEVSCHNTLVRVKIMLLIEVLL
jgi:hypothetical protein